MFGQDVEAGPLDFGDFCLEPPDVLLADAVPRDTIEVRRSCNVLCPAEVPLRPDLQPDALELLLERIGCSITPEHARSAVGLLIANILHAWQRGPNTAVFYSRDRNHYSRSNLPERYIPSFYTFGSMMRTVEWLEREELVEHFQTAPSPHAKHRSRIRASPRLITLCTDIEVVSRPKEVIILKDGDGRPSPYRDTRRTDMMRRDVREQNELVRNLELSISSTCNERDSYGRLYRVVYGPHSLQGPLRRIFNRYWNAGGRWYGGPWQNLPKVVRQNLLINNELVVELDFRTCHPRLLCAMGAVDLPFHDEAFDYYDLPGLPRRHVKLAFNILINARSEHAAVLALAQKLSQLGERNSVRVARLVVSRIRSELPGLQATWRSAIGLHLQYRDAQICARVQRNLRRNGVAALAIHDSFVVAQRHEHLLRQAMEREMEVECCQLRHG